MKPAPFRYHAPRTVADAVAILARVAPEDGRILAGGQSLIPAMALRVARPPHLVDINGIVALDRLAVEDGTLRIGALVRHVRMMQDAAPGPLGRLLARIGGHVAHLPIRARGTFCGSLANADPASEWCLVAATLGATMHAVGPDGPRTIPAAAFLRGFLVTDLRPDELLVECRLPLLPDGARAGFHEFSRRSGDYAQAMAVATFRVEDGRIAAPRVGLGAVEGAARRLPQVEAALLDAVPGEAAFRAAADLVPALVEPFEETAYRRPLAATVVLRALMDAVA